MRAPFGLRFSSGSAEEIAGRILRPRAAEDGVGLVTTPNVDHVVRLRRDAAFARAYASAEIVACDGAPVRAYARLRGLAVARVTGCDIAAAVLDGSDARQRLFFVVDGASTQDAVQAWAARRALRVATCVPPIGFARSDSACADLAAAVRSFAPTILMMGVGAPRSEVFADRWRAQLPSCWVLCVGQAVRVAMGLVRRAPPQWQHLQAEWLWRLAQEPRRLSRRYALGAVMFPRAVLEDLTGRFSAREDAA